MEKCVSKIVVLSGASRRAAKGLFSWSCVAVFCSSRQVFSAASVCSGVNDFREGEVVGALGMLAGVEAGGSSSDLVDDAGVECMVLGLMVG